MTYKGYTPEDVEYIKAHFSVDMNSKQIAEVLGLTVKKVCDIIHNVRRQDPTSIGRRNFAAIGEIREFKTSSGQLRKRIKTENGWEQVKKERKSKQVKPPKEKKDRSKPVGTKSMRNVRGEQLEFVKVGPDKWRQSPKPRRIIQAPPKPKPQPKPIPMPRPKKIDGPQKPKTSYDHSRNPAKVKIPEQTGGRYEKVDGKTWIYRKNVAS